LWRADYGGVGGVARGLSCPAAWRNFPIRQSFDEHEKSVLSVWWNMYSKKRKNKKIVQIHPSSRGERPWP
jgi:hypothetical protein